MFKSLIKVVDDVQQRKAMLERMDSEGGRKGGRKKRALGRSVSSASGGLNLQSPSVGSGERKTAVVAAGGGGDTPLQGDVKSALEYGLFRKYNSAKKSLPSGQSQDGKDGAGESVLNEGSIAEESDENEEESSDGSSEGRAPV